MTSPSFKRPSSRLSLGPKQIPTLGRVGLLVLAFSMLWLVKDAFTEVGQVGYQPNFKATMYEAHLSGSRCLVLVDMPFCYPCSQWRQTLQEDPRLASLMNDAYANYQVNGADEYTGGRALARTYDVHTFPTYLITDGMGRELMRFSPQALSAKSIRNLLTSWADTAYLPPNEAIPAVKEASSPAPAFGLVVDRLETWAQGANRIQQIQQQWNRDIWVVPGQEGALEVVYGTFQKEKEARKTQALLEVMDGIHCELISLTDQPVTFAPEAVYRAEVWP